MKNIKKITSYILVAIFTILILPLVANASNDGLEVYYDDVNSQYLLYIGNYIGDCEFAVSEDDTIVDPAGLTFYGCTTDNHNNNVIKLNESGLSGNPLYLWAKDDNSNLIINKVQLELSSTTALSSSDATFIENTNKRIAVVHGVRTITITDTNFTNYKYILVKVTDANYTSFVSLAGNLQNLSSSSNPYTAIKSMKSFYKSYTDLLPAANNTAWENLAADKIIHEPTTTKTGDVYVVWLMGYDTIGTETFDMQIMFCLREDEIVNYEYTETFTRKLPHTGLDTSLYILLGANVIAIPAVYLNKKRITKK